MTYIKERIIELAKSKGISVEELAIKIGMTYSSFKGSAKYTPINSDAIVNILSLYYDVNADWLILGKGEMIKEETEKEKHGMNITPLLDRIEKLSAENALLKKENEDLKESNKKTGRSTDVPLSMVAEPKIGYKEKR